MTKLARENNLLENRTPKNVYIITDGNSYKIGVSGNIQERIATL